MLDKDNPLIAEGIFDQTEPGEKPDGTPVGIYVYDCCNINICKSYGSHSFCCLAGSYDGARCSYAEKIQIRILNDMNPNATHPTEKPAKD